MGAGFSVAFVSTGFIDSTLYDFCTVPSPSTGSLRSWRFHGDSILMKEEETRERVAELGVDKPLFPSHCSRSFATHFLLLRAPTKPPATQAKVPGANTAYPCNGYFYFYPSFYRH